MTYSVDFRNKVVAFVRDGGGQAQAARHFDQRKLDKAALLRWARRLPITSDLMKFIANDYSA